jgi:hypothetical protein
MAHHKAGNLKGLSAFFVIRGSKPERVLPSRNRACGTVLGRNRERGCAGNERAGSTGYPVWWSLMAHHKLSENLEKDQDFRTIFMYLFYLNQ